MMSECTRAATELRAPPPAAAQLFDAGEDETEAAEDGGGLEQRALNSDATRRPTSLMPARCV